MIYLKPGETAQSNTCGSCKHFYRGDEGSGDCQIKLPPQIAITTRGNEIDYIGPTNRVTDKDTCSFWENSGATYVEQHVVKP